MITSPIGMQLNDWADRVCLDFGPYGLVGRLDGDNWQDWGAQILNAVTISGLPNPYGFSNWQEWGERLRTTL